MPRSEARAEEHGPLVLFVPNAGSWPYYARPRRDAGPPVVRDVAAVRARQRELELPEAFEWIDDVSPGLHRAAEAGGLRVVDHPLMVLDDEVPRTTPDGVELRLVHEEDDLATVSAVAAVAFGAPGTEVGSAGAEALAATAAERTSEQDDLLRRRLRSGLTVFAAAFVDGHPVATGIHQPVGDVAEVAGVGTLPAYRRRGLGAAVTALLVEDARAHGIDTVFLTAADDAVARVYGRLGFRRVGTSCIGAG